MLRTLAVVNETQLKNNLEKDSAQNDCIIWTVVISAKSLKPIAF